MPVTPGSAEYKALMQLAQEADARKKDGLTETIKRELGYKKRPKMVGTSTKIGRKSGMQYKNEEAYLAYIAKKNVPPNNAKIYCAKCGKNKAWIEYLRVTQPAGETLCKVGARSHKWIRKDEHS